MHQNTGASPAVERPRCFGVAVEAAYCNIVKVVLLCTVPEVPVTVMVVVVGIVFEIPAEQPVKTPKPTRLTVNRSIICKVRRFLKPNKQSATPNEAPGNSGLRSCRTLAIAPGVM